MDLRLFEPLISNKLIFRRVYLLLTFFLHTFVLSLKQKYTSTNSSEVHESYQPQPSNFGACHSSTLSGDCDPEFCHAFGLGKTCEARYVRFWDQQLGTDRTQRSCQCMQVPICNLLSVPGCRSYALLNGFGQSLVRKWTMSEREFRSRLNSRLRFSPASRRGSTRLWNNATQTAAYSDNHRHQTLLMGNSRFCCQTTVGVKESRRKSPRSSGTSTNGTIYFTLTLLSFILTLLLTL